MAAVKHIVEKGTGVVEVLSTDAGWQTEHARPARAATGQAAASPRRRRVDEQPVGVSYGNGNGRATSRNSKRTFPLTGARGAATSAC